MAGENVSVVGFKSCCGGAEGVLVASHALSIRVDVVAAASSLSRFETLVIFRDACRA